MAKRRKKKEQRVPDGKLKKVIDPTVAKALSHPFRSHILVTLGDRIASPKEIADELGIDPRDLDYHIKVLIGVGMIRLVRTEKRRGAREHFYELIEPLFNFDDREWSKMPELIQSSFSASLLRIVVDEAVEALQAGTFNARANHQSRTPLILDERGYDKVTKLMDETLQKVLEIGKKSAQDLNTMGKEGIPAEVFMVGFETAAGVRQRAISAAVADA
jgi:DNA-binding transcriptional ArsR family regulator